MRNYKPTGRSSSGVSKSGRCWISRAEINHMKWYAEVMNSKQNRGDRRPINFD